MHYFLASQIKFNKLFFLACKTTNFDNKYKKYLILDKHCFNEKQETENEVQCRKFCKDNII